MFTRFLFPLICLSALLAPLLEAAPPPNVIVILVDDMGQTDLSCYGSRFYETPHIDQLAKDGVRFANGYSACTVCSPTRAALLTGKYPARLHLTDWIAGHERPKAKLKIPDWQKFLPFEEITLAEQFKAAGYATASIGKWHLTPALKEGDEAYYPEKHGFDLNVGGYARGQPPSYHAPYKIPTLTEGPAGEFLTDREAAEAVKYIEANKEKPFFLYLPHYAVHTPLGGKPDVIAKYQAKAAKLPDLKQKNATYAALVESVDDSLGTIRAALKRLRLDENTIIVFTADTGGLLPVTDSLAAAISIPNATPEQLLEGVHATLRQLTQALERHKVVQISPPAGTRFDPHHHQAISVVPADQEANTVVAVLQKGYLIAERVLRPALVTVAAPK